MRTFMVLLVATVFVLAGGTAITLGQAKAGHTEAQSYMPTIKCIRGVEYYTTIHGIAPAYKPDGTLYTCKGL